MPKRGVQTGPHRPNRKRFPYEPRLVGGNMMLPADLQRCFLLDTDVIEVISDEMREVVEAWSPAAYGNIRAGAPLAPLVLPASKSRVACARTRACVPSQRLVVRASWSPSVAVS
jgi:hypothetical protein